MARSHGINPSGRAHALHLVTPMKKKLRTFNVGIERDEEGWLVASVPSLHGCHTQAKSLDVLMERVGEAIQLCVRLTAFNLQAVA